MTCESIGIAAALARAARSRRPAAAQETTPAMVAAAEKEGKVVWYTVGRREGRRGAREGLPRRVPEDRRSRSSARAPSACSSASTRSTSRTSRTSTSSTRRTPRTSSSGSSRSGSRSTRRPTCKRFAAQYKDPEGYYATWRATLSRHGLQHQPREAEGGAEGLRRPARSEVEGQARQVASGLQRHEPHRHLRAHQGAGLGLPREARRSRACSSCSRRPRRPRASRAASAP